MLILVSGGSASGKSNFAEGLVVENQQNERYYIATMKIWDSESEKRVERHHNMRKDRGFITIECPDTLKTLNPPEHASFLIEDMPNLLANICFDGSGLNYAVDEILQDIKRISNRVGMTVLVTGELCSDGIYYEGETGEYLSQLALLNVNLASLAHEVWEVVVGIPIKWKGIQQ